MRGLRYSDKKRWVEFIKKGNSENFYEVMKGFYKELVNEWIEAGNKVEDFSEKGAKIVIIIELVWHSAKEYIANRFFTSIEELEFLLYRLLNEGQLVIKWNRKLENKGDSVNVV